MGYLDQLLAGIDNTKRVVGRNVSDLVDDPSLYAEKIVGALRNRNAGVAPVATQSELTNRPLTMAERVNDTIGSLEFGGGVGILKPKKMLTPFEQRHLVAQRNAALPVEQGGLGLGPQNTAMERAKAMEFLPAYHGTQRAAEPISSFSPQKSYYGDESVGVHWMNDSPQVASDYATWIDNVGNPTVYPMMIRKGKQPSDDQFYAISEKHMVDQDPGISLYERKFVDDLRKEGFDSYDIPTYGYDPKANFGQGAVEDTTTAVFKPENIRSRFAAFDPMRRHEADILGFANPQLLGGMALGSGGILAAPAIVEALREKK